MTRRAPRMSRDDSTAPLEGGPSEPSPGRGRSWWSKLPATYKAVAIIFGAGAVVALCAWGAANAWSDVVKKPALEVVSAEVQSLKERASASDERTNSIEKLILRLEAAVDRLEGLELAR